MHLDLDMSGVWGHIKDKITKQFNFFIVAVSSMWSVFSSESLAPKDIWQTSLASKLIPAMNRLLEDDSVKVNIICSFSG